MVNARLASAAIVALAHYNAFNLQEVEQFLGGLIMGLIQKDDLTKIEQCLKDGSTLETEVQQAVTDFMKGDLADIMAGIELVGKIIQEIPTDLGDCQGMQADITRIENWAQIFNDPTKLVQTLITNVVSHFPAITSDITKTASDISADDMWDAGIDVADILIQSLGPVPAEPETLELTQW